MTNKFGVISDLHLVRQNIPNYDNVGDFRNLLNQIKDEDCEYIIIAGDFFDEKLSHRRILPHPVGESKMLEVRDIIREINIPIYCLRGNHDAESVLLTTQQALTPKLFQYPSNSWIEFPQIDFYFLDSNADEKLDRDEYNSLLLEKFKQIVSSAMKREVVKSKVLVMHENIGPRPISLTRETLSILSDKFSLTLNGHEHVYKTKPFEVKSLINLPPALPSLLQIGKFWMEKYERANQDELQRTEREGKSPFGFVTLQKSNNKVQSNFVPFEPSIIPVYYTIAIENLDLSEILNLVEPDIETIKNNFEETQSIILPEITGHISFNRRNISDSFEKFQRSFNNNNPLCFLDNLRMQNLRVESKIVPIQPLEDPELTVEGIGKRISQNLDRWIINVQENNNHFTLSSATCKHIFNQIYGEIEELVRERGKKGQYLTNLTNAIRTLITEHEYSNEVSEVHIKSLYEKVLGGR
ncbi:MAG: metallophosphoesterase family protein [Promethearchaeota archaeon]